MKSSIPGGRSVGLPVGDESFVGVLGLLDELAFAATVVAVVVAEAGRAATVGSGRTGGEVEPSALAGVETGAGNGPGPSPARCAAGSTRSPPGTTPG